MNITRSTATAEGTRAFFTAKTKAGVFVGSQLFNVGRPDGNVVGQIGLCDESDRRPESDRPNPTDVEHF